MSLRGAIQHVVGALSLITLVYAIDKYSVWYLLQASYTSLRKYVEEDHVIKLNAVMHFILCIASSVSVWIDFGIARYRQEDWDYQSVIHLSLQVL